MSKELVTVGRTTIDSETLSRVTEAVTTPESSGGIVLRLMADEAVSVIERMNNNPRLCDDDWKRDMRYLSGYLAGLRFAGTRVNEIAKEIHNDSA